MSPNHWTASEVLGIYFVNWILIVTVCEIIRQQPLVLSQWACLPTNWCLPGISNILNGEAPSPLQESFRLMPKASGRLPIWSLKFARDRWGFPVSQVLVQETCCNRHPQHVSGRCGKRKPHCPRRLFLPSLWSRGEVSPHSGVGGQWGADHSSFSPFCGCETEEGSLAQLTCYDALQTTSPPLLQ